MRWLISLLVLSGMAWGRQAIAPQSSANAKDAPSTSIAADPATDPSVVVIPAGSQVPLLLKQAISTKNAREGDAVYAETAFPFVMNERILIPPGTYIQGKISSVVKPGHGRKRAELLIHFTSMIYPSGYTVMLPGSVENTPGSDSNGVKDKEGTIQADKDTGKRAGDTVKGAAEGGMVGTIAGAAAGGYNGARYGGLAGIAGGAALALLKHSPDVKLEVGTSIQMEIQRPITVDARRIQVARAQ